MPIPRRKQKKEVIDKENWGREYTLYYPPFKIWAPMHYNKSTVMYVKYNKSLITWRMGGLCSLLQTLEKITQGSKELKWAWPIRKKHNRIT